MRATVLATAICSSLASLATAADVNAAIKRATDIPPQALAPALQRLVKERDIQLVYRAELIADRETSGATGEITSVEALHQLLDGTGLTYRYLDDETITIVPVASGHEDAGEPASEDENAPEPSAKEAQKARGFWERFRLAQVDQGEAVDARGVAGFGNSSAEGRAASIEEVIVTAQKREERLIDVPQSVTVVSADYLSKLGATQFRDFANTVPGMTFTTGGAGFNQISLRGVTTGLDISSTVGVYVDEVPYGSSSAFARGARFTLDGGLFDIERIEVLRGPQGTLYGASTMGGLVKYVSKRPDAQRSGVELQTGVSKTQDGDVNYDVAAAVNVPLISDKLALRASGFETRDGGYVDNVALGRQDVNRADIYGGRLDLLYTPNEALSLRVVGLMQNISRDGTGTVDFTAGLIGVPLDGELAQRRPIAEPYEQRFRMASVTVGYELEAATLTSVSSYQTVETAVVYDLSPALVAAFASLGPFGGVAQLERPATDKFTQELRLASSGERTVDWVIGGFYTNEDSQRGLEYVLITPAGQPAVNNILNLSGPSIYEEYAAFGDLTWHLTDKFDVTAGMRYAHNNQTYSQTATGARARSAPTTRESDDVLTYLVNARYRFDKYSTAYVRYATGYRPGGPNFIVTNPLTGLPTAGVPRFEPDELASYEIGYRTQTADGRFTADIAGYYIDWNDLQVFDLSSPFGGITNASAATVRGIELALGAQPVGGFNVIGTFAYQDSRISQSEVSLGAVAGDRLVNVPRYTATLNGDYTFAGSNLAPVLGATVRYVSDRNTAFTNSPVSRKHILPEYVSVDLRAGLMLGRVETQLYVRNVLDERGELSALVFAGRPQVAIMQPRTVGITATVRF